MHPQYGFKIINLVGRHKHVREACGEIFDMAVRHNFLERRVCLLSTTPKTFEMALDSFINVYSFDKNENKRLIINCYPSASLYSVIELNEHISKRSDNVYKSINLYANYHQINDQYKHELLGKYSIYNDFYTLTDSYDKRLEKIAKYIGPDIFYNI
jgi:hypothetical protein